MEASLASALPLLLPVILAALVWWIGTGIVLLAAGSGRGGAIAVWTGATVVLAASLLLLDHATAMTDTSGVYLAFVAAIGVWSFAEILFLTGFVTGPVAQARPEGSAGIRRFVAALLAILYHELLLLALVGVVAVLAADGPNRIGLLTFLALWLMRLSTKLNLFFGVPVLNDDFLPRPVQFLRSHFRRAPVTALFPVSVALGAMATGWLAVEAFTGGDTPAGHGYALLATLVALGTAEHGFMCVRLPLAALWGWGLPEAKPRAATALVVDPASPASRLAPKPACLAVPLRFPAETLPDGRQS